MFRVIVQNVGSVWIVSFQLMSVEPLHGDGAVLLLSLEPRETDFSFGAYASRSFFPRGYEVYNVRVILSFSLSSISSKAKFPWYRRQDH
jgi:hypothetical protein